MVDRSEFNTLSKAALTAVVAGSLFGLPTLPADASINSQVNEIDHDEPKNFTQKATLVCVSSRPSARLPACHACVNACIRPSARLFLSSSVSLPVSPVSDFLM